MQERDEGHLRPGQAGEHRREVAKRFLQVSMYELKGRFDARSDLPLRCAALRKAWKVEDGLNAMNAAYT